MNVYRIIIVLQFVLFGAISHVRAQEIIYLDDSDIDRLGIVFTPLLEIDSRTGEKFPAMTINSPMAISSIRAKYSGVLLNWSVEPGDTVKAGDEVAKIRSQDLIDVQSQWLNAQLDLQQLEFEFEKDKLLLESGIVSMLRFKQTQRAYQKSLSSMTLIEEKLIQAGFDELQRETLRDDSSSLGMYSLRSPVAGTISQLSYRVGSFIELNTSVASISSPKLWLTAQLPSGVGTALLLGQELRIEGREELLFLRQKDFEIDLGTQTMDINAEFSATTTLLPGQIVFLIIPPVTSGVIIPNTAVVHSGDETSLYIRNANGFEARIVNLRTVGGDYLAITGIQAGEQAVIQGAAILKGIQLGLGGE